MTNGHPPQGGQPPPEGYPQGQPQQPRQWPQPQQGQAQSGGGYPQYPQQQGGYGQYPQGPNQYQSGPSGPRANFGQRLLALLLDFVIVFVPLLIIFGLLGAFEDIGDSGRGPVFSSTEDLLYSFIGLAVTWSYYTFLEGGQSGQTIGKKALGIRVIRQEAGGPIGYGRALGRNAVRGLPGYLPLIGLFWVLIDNLWMLWDREKQTLHDKATRTLVVPVAAYPIQQDFSGQQSYGQPQQSYEQQQGYGPPPGTSPPSAPPPSAPPGTSPPSAPPPGGYDPNR
jgi:uncharacterized RDD family membrane protein YckC